MRKQAYRIAWVMLILLGLTLGVVRAEPASQQSQVQIISPEMNAEMRGVAPIRGSASVPNFQFYKVEFGVGPNPAQWALIGSMHDQPVMNGQLEVWDTTKLPDGVYTLRLHAVKRDGNYEEFHVRQLVIANARPSATPTTDTTPTLEIAATPATAATATTPQTEIKATATLQIIAPTAMLSAATPTPTLSRPVERKILPVDPESWGQAFVFGAMAMGAVFVLLGIVFGLRRLL